MKSVINFEKESYYLVIGDAIKVCISYISVMKNELLKILNAEYNDARSRAERSKRNADLVGVLAETRVLEIIQKLIKTIQDKA